MKTRRHEDMVKETWKKADVDMETWRHGDMETWRHGDMDMETWRHGDMDMETWRHGDIDMETWTLKHGDIKMEKGKRKPRRFSLIRLSFALRANGSLSFVHLLTKKKN
jgi:hypothetical protein